METQTFEKILSEKILKDLDTPEDWELNLFSLSHKIKKYSIYLGNLTKTASLMSPNDYNFKSPGIGNEIYLKAKKIKDDIEDIKKSIKEKNTISSIMNDFNIDTRFEKLKNLDKISKLSETKTKTEPKPEPTETKLNLPKKSKWSWFKW